MPGPFTVLAPVSGVVRAMADVPDPVFGAELVGPGMAIDPTRGGVVEAIAPIDGTIVKLHPHAFVVTAGDVVVSWDPAAVEAGGRSPICPVVALDGKPGCLTPLVPVGAAIRSGEALFEWN